MKCVLREMEEKDLAITFTWRNEDRVRETAMSPNPISYNEHEAMFKFNNSLKLIFDVDDVPSGYVNCSIDSDVETLKTGEWGFHLAPGARGKGYAEIMLKMALIYLRDQQFEAVYGRVRVKNLTSLYLHQRLKFKPTQENNSEFKRFIILL